MTNDRCLGVEVDKTLGWQSEVDTICKKVFAGIGALKGIRSLVPHQTLMRMYKALVAAYFDYCFEFWGCMGDRLQRLQNRAGRIITFSDCNTRSADILQDLGCDTLDNRCSKQLAISVFKYLNNLYPESLKTCSNRTSRVHSYNIRGASNNVFVSRPPTEAATGGQSWNGLENELKDKINLHSFKSALSLP